jgi:hypothetical protein
VPSPFTACPPAPAPASPAQRAAAHPHVKAPPLARLYEAFIHSAATYAAAIVVNATLHHLCYSYSERKRNEPHFFDCSSFVTRMYDRVYAWLTPPGHSRMLASAAWAAP